ncbi:MAG: RagB/SusD family nutrient uptake outer membrane protein [Bacteroidales bacterium]|nr:RagB/SusD family nutrient uptake outer membrane protein [Bacteroidales bacterium]
MKKYFAILASLVLVLSSCEKAFEVSDSERLSGSQAAAIVEESPEFLTSYVNGFYSWMVQFNTGGGSHGDFGHLGCLYNLDMMGLDIAICGTWNWGTFDINHDYGQYDYRRPYQYWNFYYTLIKKCNEVIDFFSEEDPTNPTLCGYLGQAYALRAMSYYYLIQIFQDPVTGTTPSASFRLEAPAVPIVYAVRDGKSTEEASAKGGRNTMKDLCEQIESDLASSLSLLDGYDRGGDKNQVNYEVAQGIAARYYLLTQQWDKAIEAATAAQNGFDLMDNTRLHSGFMELEDNEVMWGFNHNTETQTAYASFFSHLSNDCSGYGGVGQSVHCIDRSLYDAIPESDFRKSLFNGPEGDADAATTGGKLPYAARKFGYMASWLQDYTYMRKSEMILIAAEAHARLGDGQAASTLKELMEKRDPAWNYSSVSIDDILLQRRIELWGEGFEYFDLRRNGLAVDRKYSGTNHTVAAQFVFPAHAKSWNFQIPKQEMQNNPNITEEEQNEWISGAKEVN